MKLLVFFVVGLTVCWAAFVVEEKCAKDQKLERDDIVKISRESNTPEDNETYGKYYLCVWKGRGIMNEKDAFVKEPITVLLNEVFFIRTLANETKEKIISKIDQLCVPIHAEKSEQTALKFKNCLIGVINENKISAIPQKE
ncbi:hypothetical protein ILUMI_23235 [Ignelater luminosus]|uniref:Uncharacterized protein n=1 Tax=Ignelater luminosus TaxID=2038154 RepID=A0A8K0FX09_IGNLU|nr:hypothetical protein ILUMI_23235 [Ignelater luminosus]